jgi:hypothetical protein
MLIVERHNTEAEAQFARRVIVIAQQRVDKVMETIWGQPIFPCAADAYVVVPDGDKFALAIDDPSLG